MYFQLLHKLLLIVSMLASASLYAQSPEDMTLNVCAKTELYTLDTTKTIVTVFWKSSPTAALRQNYRFKSKTSLSWSSVNNITLSDTFFTDTITTGSEREYIVRKDTVNPTAANPSPLNKYGYILVGRKVPATIEYGRMLVLIDSIYINALDSVLLRYKHDLIGDGYIPEFMYVSSTNTVVNIKRKITNAYAATGPALAGVMFLGHVPVPYSGDFKSSGYYPPDGHTTISAPPSHEGAWATDLFYGDMDTALWTDITVNNTLGASADNNNTIGDGKYDNTVIPSAVELAIGRVDLTDLPSFAVSDTQLMERYLTKNHNYRAGKTVVRKRLLQDDNLGLLTGEPFGGSSFQTINPLYGDSVDKLDWNSTLPTNSYQFASGFGFGSYTTLSGVVTTGNFASTTYNATFTTLFGSYFGDFNNQDNLLRAALASEGEILTCAWSGRPKWYFHQMGTGNPIGLSTLMTQNIYNGSSILYPDAHFGVGLVHASFHGDITLRLSPYESPQNFVIKQDSCNNRFKLSWNKSADTSVIAYIVQRSGYLDSSFTDLVIQTTDTFYTDSFPLTGSNIYMVRAVKTENTCSGMYYNLSHGAIDSVVYKLPIANAGNDSSICSMQSLQLGKDTVYADSNIVYYWSPGGALNDSTLIRPTWLATQDQTFVFHVMDTLSKCMVSDTAIMNIVPIPTDTILTPTSYNACGDTIDISASTVGSGSGNTYSWTFTSATPASIAGVGLKGPHQVYWDAVGTYDLVLQITDNSTSCFNLDTFFHSVGCVLPVSLIDFNVRNTIDCKNTIIAWETATEFDLLAYEVNVLFENGQSSQFFVQLNQKHISEDGTYQYQIKVPIENSFIRKVELSEITSSGSNQKLSEKYLDNQSCNTINIYPNPIDLSKTNILFIESNLRINNAELMDANGNVVSNTEVGHSALKHSISLPLNLSSGMYFIKYGTTVYKIMVVK